MTATAVSGHAETQIHRPFGLMFLSRTVGDTKFTNFPQLAPGGRELSRFAAERRDAGFSPPPARPSPTPSKRAWAPRQETSSRLSASRRGRDIFDSDWERRRATEEG